MTAPDGNGEITVEVHAGDVARGQRSLSGSDASRRPAGAAVGSTVVLTEATQIVDRSGQRLRMSGELTVVALAGATGSGKSSLFNALTGLDLAAIGTRRRRPACDAASACVWGEERPARC